MNAIFIRQDKNSSSDFIRNNFEQIIQSDLDKKELKFEEHPLIYF